MDLFSQFISEIISLKGDIIFDLIEQIEGRPCVLEDAKNAVLAHESGSSKELFIYRDIPIGYIEFDLKEMAVKFTPINTQNDATHTRTSYSGG